MKAIF
jgi:hypothetical protein